MTKGWFKFKFLNILHSFEHHKYYNGLYIEFRQSFAKETFSYDKYLKS